MNKPVQCIRSVGPAARQQCSWSTTRQATCSPQFVRSRPSRPTLQSRSHQPEGRPGIPGIRGIPGISGIPGTPGECAFHSSDCSETPSSVRQAIACASQIGHHRLKRQPIFMAPRQSNCQQTVAHLLFSRTSGCQSVLSYRKHACSI
jgi:hypothetical protein